MTDQTLTGVALADLMAVPEDRRVEVVRGQLREVDMSPGYIHTTTIENLYDLLKPFVKERRLGIVKIDGLNYLLSASADTVRESRIPDLSFVKAENIPPDFDRSSFSYFPGAPDLAVEVVSPSEDSVDIDEKIGDYFAAGTEQVWVIYPRLKKVHVYPRPASLRERSYTIYTDGETFESPLFPGLIIPVAEIFRVEE
jgi:Uma2 family endonuclease